jgi:hypothetical protein
LYIQRIVTKKGTKINRKEGSLQEFFVAGADAKNSDINAFRTASPDPASAP